jgi:hypothetical protein
MLAAFVCSPLTFVAFELIIVVLFTLELSHNFLCLLSFGESPYLSSSSRAFRQNMSNFTCGLAGLMVFGAD